MGLNHVTEIAKRVYLQAMRSTTCLHENRVYSQKPMQKDFFNSIGHERTNRPRQSRVCLCSVNRPWNTAKLLPRSSTRPHLARDAPSDGPRSLRRAGHDAGVVRVTGNMEYPGPYSRLMLAVRITFAHFPVSSVMSFPKSPGEPTIVMPPKSASCAVKFGIGKARIDLPIDFVDDFGRRAHWRAHAVPRTHLVARYGLAHGRHLR
jgi:hypothetical protein